MNNESLINNSLNIEQEVLAAQLKELLPQLTQTQAESLVDILQAQMNIEKNQVDIKKLPDDQKKLKLQKLLNEKLTAIKKDLEEATQAQLGNFLIKKLASFSAIASLETTNVPEKKRNSLLNIDEKIKMGHDVVSESISATSSVLGAVEKLSLPINTMQHLQTTSSDLHPISFVLRLYDFIRIPVLYIGAAITNKPLSDNLSDDAKRIGKWTLAVLGITLGVIGIFNPGLGVPLLLIGASVGLLSAAGAFFYQMYKEIKQIFTIKRNDKEIKKLSADIIKQKDEAKLLKRRIAKQDFINTADKTNIAQLIATYTILSHKQEKDIHTLQQLNQTQYELKRERKKNAVLPILNKTVGVGLAVLGLIGAALSIPFPAVGGGIMVGVAVAGFAYTVGVLTYLGIKSLYDRQQRKQQEKQDKLDKENLSKEALSRKKMPKPGTLEAKHSFQLESTAKFMSNLYGKKSEATLEKLLHLDDNRKEAIKKLNQHLEHLIISSNKIGIIEFFAGYEHRLHEVSKQHLLVVDDELNLLFRKKLDQSLMNKACKLLTEALSDVENGKIKLPEKLSQVFSQPNKSKYLKRFLPEGTKYDIKSHKNEVTNQESSVFHEERKI